MRSKVEQKKGNIGADTSEGIHTENVSNSQVQLVNQCGWIAYFKDASQEQASHSNSLKWLVC